jgi:hypothetical protein
MRRFGFRRPAIAVAVASGLLLFPFAGAAWAPKGPSWNSQMPLSGTVQDDATFEAVALVGQMHVVIDLGGSQSSGFSVDLHANLDQTSGSGQTSGQQYVADGADQASVHLPPGPLTGSVSFAPSFALHPPSPCRTEQMPGPCHAGSGFSALVTVSFNTDGGISVVVALDGGGSATT